MLYSAFCPSCKFKVYSQKQFGKGMKFSCLCSCHFVLEPKFCTCEDVKNVPKHETHTGVIDEESIKVLWNKLKSSKIVEEGIDTQFTIDFTLLMKENEWLRKEVAKNQTKETNKFDLDEFLNAK